MYLFLVHVAFPPGLHAVQINIFVSLPNALVHKLSTRFASDRQNVNKNFGFLSQQSSRIIMLRAAFQARDMKHRPGVMNRTVRVSVPIELCTNFLDTYATHQLFH